ncbi:MAG: hypothetical protein JXA20_15970 [Spirochaetes bacterium]|nr:hypothetical protein [Spirochaetota bacterium]
MNLLDALREKTGNRRCVLAFGALYLASQAIIGIVLHPLGAGKVIAAQTTLSAPLLHTVFGEWRADGLIDRYALHFYFDFLHPFWYGLFLASAMALVLNRSGAPRGRSALLALPLLAGTCDCTENIFHIIFLNQGGSVVQPWVALSGIASIAKWSLAALSIAAICLLWALTIVKSGGGTDEAGDIQG